MPAAPPSRSCARRLPDRVRIPIRTYTGMSLQRGNGQYRVLCIRRSIPSECYRSESTRVETRSSIVMNDYDSLDKSNHITVAVILFQTRFDRCKEHLQLPAKSSLIGRVSSMYWVLFLLYDPSWKHIPYYPTKSLDCFIRIQSKRHRFENPWSSFLRLVVFKSRTFV